jgi:hypothetical protein
MFDLFSFFDRTPITPIRGGIEPWRDRQKPARVGWKGILLVGFILLVAVWVATIVIALNQGRQSVVIEIPVEGEIETPSFTEILTSTPTPTLGEETQTPTPATLEIETTVRTAEGVLVITTTPLPTYTALPTYTPMPTYTPEIIERIIIVTPNAPTVRTPSGSTVYGSAVVPDQRQSQPQTVYQQQPVYVYPSPQFIIPSWDEYISPTPYIIIVTATPVTPTVFVPTLEAETQTPTFTETAYPTNEPTSTLTETPTLTPTLTELAQPTDEGEDNADST